MRRHSVMSWCSVSSLQYSPTVSTIERAHPPVESRMLAMVRMSQYLLDICFLSLVSSFLFSDSAATMLRPISSDEDRLLLLTPPAEATVSSGIDTEVGVNSGWRRMLLNGVGVGSHDS